MSVVGVLCPHLTKQKRKLTLQDGVGGEWRSVLLAFWCLTHIILCCTYVRTSSKIWTLPFLNARH